METVELKVEMVGIHCERKIRRIMSKIKGVDRVEVELNVQKVTVGGTMHRNKVVKALRRAGLKADFWSNQNELLLCTFASGTYCHGAYDAMAHNLSQH